MATQSYYACGNSRSRHIWRCTSKAWFNIHRCVSTPTISQTNTISEQEQRAYAGAGAHAEQALSSIRTVTALNAQEKELKSYQTQLDSVMRFGKKKVYLGRVVGVVVTHVQAVANGVGIGMSGLTMFGACGLVLWYGATLVNNGTYNSTTGKAAVALSSYVR